MARLAQDPPWTTMPKPGFRGWKIESLHGAVTLMKHKHKRAPGPTPLYKFWRSIYQHDFAKENRQLYAFLAYSWKNTLTSAQRDHWASVASTVTIQNYKGNSVIPNAFSLFVRHNKYKNGNPNFNLWLRPQGAWSPDFDPPDPYTIPAPLTTFAGPFISFGTLYLYVTNSYSPGTLTTYWEIKLAYPAPLLTSSPWLRTQAASRFYVAPPGHSYWQLQYGFPLQTFLGTCSAHIRARNIDANTNIVSNPLLLDVTLT